jgi:3-methylfumaryl-CoA hydratase
MTDMEIPSKFQEWVGRSMTTEDEITLPAVRRIGAMLDIDPDAFTHGSAIPPHWYSMFFTPNARQSQIGHDGHPRKGEFLPPIPLPRRMFVGRQVQWFQPLRVGHRAIKRSEIASVSAKEGRSGPLVFLTVRHTIELDSAAALIELQEVVYRESAPAPTSSAGSAPAMTAADAMWSEQVVVDPVLAFRYSAVTWNAHRIHYDADYARTVEGYPACVINGALTLHLLIDAALRNVPGKLTNLKARLVKPLFTGGRILLAGRQAVDGRVEAWAGDENGRLAVSAEIQVAS